VTSSANLNNHLLYVISVTLCILGVILFFLFCCRHRRRRTNNHHHSHHSQFTDGIKSSVKPRQPLIHHKGPMVPSTTTRISNDYIANSADSIPITRQYQQQRYVNTLSSDLASVTSSNLYYAQV
ncbi:unnamed protein product, partial [Adineta steineri]